METASSEVTELLKRLAAGDQNAGDELAPLVYRELRRLAASHLRRERRSHTWQTSDLVNEAYMKLAGEPNLNFNGRTHFFGIAAVIMRRLLTEYARRRRSEKRGGKVSFVPLLDGYGIPDGQCEMIAELDEALERLAVIDPVAAQVVELRFFGGRTEEEIAEILGVSRKTVARKWVAARAWLLGQLRPDSE
jgi:RNA polymerase sigma factor (TIGR02999 family)